MGMLTDLATLGTEGAFGGAVKKRLTGKRDGGDSSDAPGNYMSEAGLSDSSSSGDNGSNSALRGAYNFLKKRSSGKRSN